MGAPPVFFETPRLRVRRFATSDVTAFVGYRADPQVARYQGWSDFTLERGAAFVASLQGETPGVPGEWFQFAIADRATDRLLGDLALHVDADEPRQAEVGFTLAAAEQGQGYATEALTGFLGYAFETFSLHRVVAITDARNTRSAALLERVGMRREGHFRDNVFFKGEWGSELVYAILAREWAGQE